MEVSRRKMTLAVLGPVAVAVPLAAALATLGKAVALAIAVVAIVALVASEVCAGLLTLSPLEDEDAARRALWFFPHVHAPVVLGAPFVVFAAHPWGLASAAVGPGALVACQAFIVVPMTVVGSIRRQRARRTPPTA
jgi:hypothetical protein